MSSPARIFGILTLLVAAYGIALPLAPLALRLLAPPVTDFIVEGAQRLPDGRIRLTARMEKRWCVFTSLGFAYGDRAGQVWRVGYAAADQPPNTDTNRPAGVQTLGPWIVAAPPVVHARHLRITVRHRCGLFAVITPLATLDLSALAPE